MRDDSFFVDMAARSALIGWRKCQDVYQSHPHWSLSYISKASKWFLGFEKPQNNRLLALENMANSTQTDEITSSCNDSLLKRKAISEMRLKDPRLWDIVGW